jgi:hypothetical protein
MASIITHSRTRPSALLAHLYPKPSHSRAAGACSLAAIRLAPRQLKLRRLQLNTRRERPFGARSMAWGADTEGRPEMLTTAPYSPPSWASELHPVPPQFTSLGQVSTLISITCLRMMDLDCGCLYVQNQGRGF